MEELIADVTNVKFDIEVALEQQLGIQPLPFPGMDKSVSAVCEFYVKGNCLRGPLCPLRHTTGEKFVVCKHWLRGLCKKGDECEFLHEYDMTKMPECYFYSKFGVCNNKECPFLHVDPETKIKDCPWYDRGFCKHGPMCKHRHVRRVLCVNYLCGFCPDGPACKHMHPRFEIPNAADKLAANQIICHACRVPGHKSTACPMVLMYKEKKRAEGGQTDYTFKRPLELVTCFKCRQRGHYANKCPNSHAEYQPNRMAATSYPVPDFTQNQPIQTI